MPSPRNTNLHHLSPAVSLKLVTGGFLTKTHIVRHRGRSDTNSISWRDAIPHGQRARRLVQGGAPVQYTTTTSDSVARRHIPVFYRDSANWYMFPMGASLFDRAFPFEGGLPLLWSSSSSAQVRPGFLRLSTLERGARLLCALYRNPPSELGGPLTLLASGGGAAERRTLL